MSKTSKPPAAREIEEFNDAAWQNDVDLIDQLASAHSYLVDPAHPYLVAALHAACGACQQDSARLLVEKYHADVNAAVNGATALHEAMNACDWDTARMLIEEGADVNAANEITEGFVDGWRPLHYAVSHGSAEMVEFLIKRGADPGMKESTGLTVAEFARNKGRSEMAALLEKLAPPGTKKHLGATKCPKP